MIVGIDVGGDSIKLASAPDSFELPSDSLDSLRAKITGNFETDYSNMVRMAQSIGESSIRGIGMSIAGDLDDESRMVVRSVNNPHWNGQPVATMLEGDLGCKVFIDNDARAGAAGEYYYGGTTGDFAYVIWGSGIGGVIVRDNKTEHLPTIVDVNQREYWDKYFAVWESECGGKNLLNQLGKPADSFTQAERDRIFGLFMGHLRDFSVEIGIARFILAGGVAALFGDHFGSLDDQNLDCALSAHPHDSGLYGAFAVARRNLQAR